MGTGTVNPVASVDLARALGERWRVAGYVYTQQVLYEGGKGYQAGDRYAAGVAARWQAAPEVGLRGGVELQGETAERWGGVVHTDDGNRGRIDAMLVAGMEWAVAGPLSVDLAVKVPVVTHVVGGQLDMPAIVEVGVGWSFGRRRKPDVHVHEDDHDHDHDHDHEAVDPEGVDIEALGAPGEAVDLVPVEGKITVFDFWATWCEPCEDVEAALIGLAREHPGKIAIRKIDVVDWDSEAVARWLTPGGFALPHVKVYAGGELVLEKSGEPHDASALIEELHRVIDAAAAP
jgi:thiol-disulfide isomerase/thioredoxin